MRKRNLIIVLLATVVATIVLSFRQSKEAAYLSGYYKELNIFKNAQKKTIAMRRRKYDPILWIS